MGHKVDLIKILSAVALACLFIGTSFGIMISGTSPNIATVIEPGSMYGPASYLVFKDSSNITYAKSGVTGSIEFASAQFSSAINFALSATNNASGGRVFVVPDVYIATQSIKLYVNTISGYNNVELASTGATIISYLTPELIAGHAKSCLNYGPYYENALIAIGKSRNIIMAGFVLNGNNIDGVSGVVAQGDGTGGVQGADRIVIEDLEVENFDMDDAGAGSYRNGVGILMMGCTNSHVGRVYVHDSWLGIFFYGYADINSPRGNVVSDSTFSCLQSLGIYASMDTGTVFSRCTIADNINPLNITDFGAGGVWLGEGRPFDSYGISDCFIQNNSMGVNLAGASSNVSVIGNHITGNYGNGVILGTRSQIINNFIFNNGQSAWLANETRAGVAAYASASVVQSFIEGNFIGDDQSTPTQIYGVFLNRSSYVIVTGNRFVSPLGVTSIYDIGPTNIVSMNYADALTADNSWQSENLGSISITGAFSIVMVNHLLRATPTIVIATCNNTGAGNYSISSITATQFTISFTNQPGTSEWRFYWYAEV